MLNIFLYLWSASNLLVSEKLQLWKGIESLNLPWLRLLRFNAKGGVKALLNSVWRVEACVSRGDQLIQWLKKVCHFKVVSCNSCHTKVCQILKTFSTKTNARANLIECCLNSTKTWALPFWWRLLFGTGGRLDLTRRLICMLGLMASVVHVDTEFLLVFARLSLP